MQPSSIAGINRLSAVEKCAIYCRLIPEKLLEHFELNPNLQDNKGRDLLRVVGPPGSFSVEMSLFHQYDFPDPVLYGHMTDTANGQIHVLLYIINDPDAPRFDVDRMPDGEPTKFGTLFRNLEAEQAAMQTGLMPGQIRSGLRILSDARSAFDRFIKSLGNNIYFVDPLYYHNAIIFERYGMAYQSGRKQMQAINEGFSSGGDLETKLDDRTFRPKNAADSIRLRSWAIHDGILGKPFSNVTMYKVIDESAGLNTAPGVDW